MSKAQVYSYVRFSDPKQAGGHSVSRQAEYAQRWAAEHGLELDTALSMQDEGLSAYHQQHVKRGALGVFLAAVEAGAIAPGSVLVVEGLDRLSRAEPVLAQAQLTQIISAGISVVTASDGKIYSRESLRSQPMDLIYSLIVMIRAHEESDTKSSRVTASIRRRCLDWQAGKWRGIIRNGKDPRWVRPLPDGSGFELHPENAAMILHVIAEYRRGLGPSGVMGLIKSASEGAEQVFKNPAHFYKIVRNPCLIGRRTFDVKGEIFELEGYYPPLMTAADFEALQQLVEDRHRRIARRGEIVNVVTGIGITRCGYCGAPMAGQTTMRGKPIDQVPRGHRRIMCNGARHTHSCPEPGSISVEPIERALLTYCSDVMNLASLQAQPDGHTAAVKARLAELRREESISAQRLERLTQALMDSDDPPQTFFAQARKLEAGLAGTQREIAQLEAELAASSAQHSPTTAAAWAAIAERALIPAEEAARLTARQLMLDTFADIVIYIKGHMPESDTRPSKRMIDIHVVSKTGVARWIRADMHGTIQTQATESAESVEAVLKEWGGVYE